MAHLCAHALRKAGEPFGAHGERVVLAVASSYRAVERAESTATRLLAELLQQDDQQEQQVAVANEAAAGGECRYLPLREQSVGTQNWSILMISGLPRS